MSGNIAARVESIVRAAEEEAAAIQRDLDAQRRVAEAEARRYLTDAKRQADQFSRQRLGLLRELTDELIERAEAAKRQFDGLLGQLERVTAAMEREPIEMPDLPVTELGAPDQPRDDDPSLRLPPSSPPPVTRGPDSHQPEAPPAPMAPPSKEASPAPKPMGTADEQPPPRPGRRSSSPTPRETPSPGTSGDQLDAARLVAIEMAVAGRTRDDVDGHLREAFRIEHTKALLDDIFGGDAHGSSRVLWGQ